MKFEVETGYERRPSPLKVDVSISGSGEPTRNIGEEMFQSKRSLTMRIGVEFWSNDVQLMDKAKQAEVVARSYLFKDMLPIVDEITLRSDQPDVIALANSLKVAMLGNSDCT